MLPARLIPCVLSFVSLLACLPAGAAPPDGQMVIDPVHPQWLMRQGGDHVFVCGPGDPEGFLYRGERQDDGTRRGDQDQIIDKLISHGGNCLYLQAIRSHGGDGAADHNPFVDSDPALGLDERILSQWDDWFARLDEHGVLIYFFFYDDYADPWGDRSATEVGDAERKLLETLVRRYAHLRNLIWIVAEEAEEAFTPERLRAAGEIIAAADPNEHLVGAHHHSGVEFKAWTADGPFRHFAMQLNVAADDAHAAALEAWREAAGRYQFIYSENTDAAPTIEYAWSCAMAGAMPMLLGVDVASTSETLLEQCRAMQQFFEATDFYTMSPRDDLAAGDAAWALADEGRSAIAYARDGTRELGARAMAAGLYRVRWLDCDTTHSLVDHAALPSDGPLLLARPPHIGPHCAVALTRIDDLVYPDAEWNQLEPEAVGLDRSKLQEFAETAGGRGCVVRHGRLVFSWGDVAASGDLASASKPLYSHLLFRAIEQGLAPSVDEPVVNFQPCLQDLNADLGYKDRGMTFRHLAYQTACLGFSEPPGTAFDYNDSTMGFFWDVLINRVYGVPWSEARDGVFRTEFDDVLQFQDAFTFPTEGRMSGRPRMSPRDFARFGLLYLRHGAWGGRQVLSDEYVARVRTEPLSLEIPRTAEQSAESCGTRSIGGGANQTDHNGGYSWLWWLNAPARDGRRWWPDAPDDMYAALGHCGQRGVAIIPSLDLVVSWNDAHELHCNRELGSQAFGALAEAVRAK